MSERDEKEVARFNSGEHKQGFWWRARRTKASGRAWPLLFVVAMVVICFAAVRFL